MLMRTTEIYNKIEKRKKNSISKWNLIVNLYAFLALDLCLKIQFLFLFQESNTFCFTVPDKESVFLLTIRTIKSHGGRGMESEKEYVVFSAHNKTSIFIWRYECHENNQHYKYRIIRTPHTPMN